MHWLVAVFLFAFGCGGGGNTFVELEEDPSYPGTPSDPANYESFFDFESVSRDCIGFAPSPIDMESELRIFRGPGITDADVEMLLQGLASYWAEFEVSFFTQYDVIDVPMSVAVHLDEGTLLARIEQDTGRPVETLTPEELEAAAAVAILHNVNEFLDVYGDPAQSNVNVVLLPNAVDSAAALGPGAEVGGVALSPELVAAAPEFASLEGALPEDFAPVAFVGVREAYRHPDLAALIISHELGHAYGLVHRDESGNLLAPIVEECNLTLESDQVATVSDRIASQAGSLTTGTRLISLADAWSEVRAHVGHLGR